MKRKAHRLQAALEKSGASGAPAASRGIPSLRGHDHTGITVPDLEAAIRFFVDVVGCELITTFGPFRDDSGSFMADTLNVHPRAVIEQIALLRCGMGSNIELFQYSAPDQRNDIPKNSDIGGHHLAFYVDDIDTAVAYLKAQGVRVLAGPLPVTEGPAAGQTINYFLAPWGLQLELISYPRGMAYEATARTVLWSPKAPDK
ncbi:VOC family protein [Variovorax sp. dw_954]|uniref:VOC family protein n=1 Tax=Variovorax sp. dw_954 TaxID=2720078 RepID=UPI001BD29E6F|nr:VOC family protein [Variovorax sp. dw_954]